MKKFGLYLITILVALGILFYLFGENGIIGGLLALFGLGGSKVGSKIIEKEKELEKETQILKERIKNLKKQRDELEVKDLSPQEEVDYWKNQ